MNFKKIPISNKTPRNITTFPISLYKGLKMYYFFGFFFLIGALFLLIVSLKFKMIFPSLIFIIIIIASYFMIKKVKNQIKIRTEVFINGKIIKVKVINHGRRFNFLKSERDYTITLSHRSKQKEKMITIVCKSKFIWHQCPINKSIIGLEYNKNYFFAEEVKGSFSTTTLSGKVCKV